VHFLSADVNAMNHADATGQTPLDVVCHDWATFASGTTTAQEGELSLVDCPKDGCLGFAFTLPDSFVGNKTYRDVGAPLAQCFGCDAWKSDNRLVALSDSTGKLKDPLCGPPRVATDADFCAACTGEGAGSSAPTLAMSSISMSMAPPTPKPVGAPIEAAASTSGEATGALTSRTGATTKPAHASRTAPAQGVVGLPTPTPTPTPTPKPSPTPTPIP
jgi:hypothetical protein